MNERIKELAEHCDFYVGNEHYNESHQEKQRIWTEKFAELIVKECLDMCLTKVGNGDYNRGRMDCHDNIKEHFGVEE